MKAEKSRSRILVALHSNAGLGRRTVVQVEMTIEGEKVFWHIIKKEKKFEKVWMNKSGSFVCAHLVRVRRKPDKQ